MPQTQLLISTPSGVNVVNHTANSKRAVIRQMSGAKRSIVFPYGPIEVDYEELGMEYDQVDRPGKVPILVAARPKARSVSLTAIIADKGSGGLRSVESFLDALRSVAADDVDCLFVHGVRALPYRVRITQYSYTSLRRDIDGNVTQAEVSIQMDEKPVVNQRVVQLRAISYTPPPQPSNHQKEDGDDGGESGGGGGGGGSNDDEEIYVPPPCGPSGSDDCIPNVIGP